MTSSHWTVSAMTLSCPIRLRSSTRFLQSVCVCFLFIVFLLTNRQKNEQSAELIPHINQSRLAQIYDYKYRNYLETTIVKKTCSSFPSNLEPKILAFKEYASLEMLEQFSFNLKPGGQYLPPDCRPHENTAIIVPFRDRNVHLSVFLLHIHPFLQKQKLGYTVFVINQVSNVTFNKGVLMNSGFMEIAKRHGHRFDCFIFHDVDLLPEDERMMYTCDDMGPKHFAYALEEWNYKLLYPQLVGGVIALTWRQFLALNGYSNQFSGWGGEDDDFYGRILETDYRVIRYPQAISRYTMVKHLRDRGNSENKKRYELLSAIPERQKVDGLNNLVYNLVKITEKPLFTQIDIDFNPEEVQTARPHELEFPYLHNS